MLVALPIYRLLDYANLRRLLPVRDPIARRRATHAIFATALLFANFHAAVASDKVRDNAAATDKNSDSKIAYPLDEVLECARPDPHEFGSR